MRVSLSKWYLDVVATDGALAVGYAARLGLGALAVDYASLLTCDPDGRVATRTTWRRAEPPAIGAGAIAWEAPLLGFSASFRPRAPALKQTLLAAEDGAVVWTCHAPAAEVSAFVDGRPLEGLGYVEHLELTIAPWRLPIRELRCTRRAMTRPRATSGPFNSVA